MGARPARNHDRVNIRAPSGSARRSSLDQVFRASSIQPQASGAEHHTPYRLQSALHHAMLFADTSLLSRTTAMGDSRRAMTRSSRDGTRVRAEAKSRIDETGGADAALQASPVPPLLPPHPDFLPSTQGPCLRKSAGDPLFHCESLDPPPVSPAISTSQRAQNPIQPVNRCQTDFPLTP